MTLKHVTQVYRENDTCSVLCNQQVCRAPTLQCQPLCEASFFFLSLYLDSFKTHDGSLQQSRQRKKNVFWCVQALRAQQTRGLPPWPLRPLTSPSSAPWLRGSLPAGGRTSTSRVKETRKGGLFLLTCSVSRTLTSSGWHRSANPHACATKLRNRTGTVAGTGVGLVWAVAFCRRPVLKCSDSSSVPCSVRPRVLVSETQSQE